MNRFIALGGAALLAVGLILGFTPVTSGVADCGRVILPSGDADLLNTLSASGDPNGLRGAGCPSARTDRATLVYVSSGIGLFLLIYAGWASHSRRQDVTPGRSPASFRP